MAALELKVPVETPELPDFQDRLERLDSRANVASPDSRVLPEPVDRSACLENLDLLARVDSPASRAGLDPLEPLGSTDCPDSPDLPDWLVIRDAEGLTDNLVDQESAVARAALVRVVMTAVRVRTDCLDFPDSKVLLDSPARLDLLDLTARVDNLVSDN